MVALTVIGTFQGSTRPFVLLIKAIGEAGSNHEEDRVIRKEVRLLQEKLKEPNINPVCLTLPTSSTPLLPCWLALGSKNTR